MTWNEEAKEMDFAWLTVQTNSHELDSIGKNEYLTTIFKGGSSKKDCERREQDWTQSVIFRKLHQHNCYCSPRCEITLMTIAAGIEPLTKEWLPLCFTGYSARLGSNVGTIIHLTFDGENSRKIL